MPIYEYRCNQCGNISELLTGIGSKDDVTKCKNCGSNDLVKIMSAASFTFPDPGQPPCTTCCGMEERCDIPPCSNGPCCAGDH